MTVFGIRVQNNDLFSPSVSPQLLRLSTNNYAGAVPTEASSRDPLANYMLELGLCHKMKGYQYRLVSGILSPCYQMRIRDMGYWSWFGWGSEIQWPHHRYQVNT